MHTQVFILRCLSNLHVGQGDSHMKVIDKQVQRDSVTKFPAIHGSSLKGALREYFEHKAQSGTIPTDLITNVFGADSQRMSNQTLAAGKLYFGQGQLLSLPVRSDKHPFFNVTTREILAEFVETLSNNEVANHSDWISVIQPLIEVSDDELKIAKVFQTKFSGCILEEESFQAEFLPMEGKGAITDHKPWRLQAERILGGPFALMNHTDFQELTQDLPVIARNQLNNGQSENLWYEEIVPREARFFYVHQWRTNVTSQFP